MYRLLLLLLPGLLLGACATIPTELARGPYTQITPQEAQTGKYDGQRVRWGGVIIGAAPGEKETCFRVLALPLDSSARPERSDNALGRFIGCAPAFYDPAVYAAGREITVTGELAGVESGTVDNYRYAFPKLRLETVYLWPQRPNVIYVPYYDPFWGPLYGPYWPYRPYPWW